MLEFLTRYMKNRSGAAKAAPQDGVPGWRDSGSDTPVRRGPSEAATPRDLVVEGAVANALREVFTQERIRTGGGAVVTIYDPDQIWPRVTSAVAAGLGNARGIDRIRLLDAQHRHVLATIERFNTHAPGGLAVRMLEVDIRSADRPDAEVPMTLVEQSDVAVVLLGSDVADALLSDLRDAMLAPSWRCKALVFGIPSGASQQMMDRLRAVPWDASVFIERVEDPAAQLPPLWESILTAASTDGAPPHTLAPASHIDRINRMLASMSTADDSTQPPPTAAAKPAEAASPAPHQAEHDAPMATPEPRADSVVLDDRPTMAFDVRSLQAQIAQMGPDGADLPIVPSPIHIDSRAGELPTLEMPAEETSAAHTAQEPTKTVAATTTQALPVAASAAAAAADNDHRGDTDIVTAAPTPDTALEPLAQLPGALASAVVELDGGQMLAHTGQERIALQAAAVASHLWQAHHVAAVSLGTAPSREITWVSGELQHVLQPVAGRDGVAILLVVDAGFADLAASRWACAVAARNAALDLGAAAKPPRS
jgi:predicted regulator of Ras-like GTPase activity (Roadblock/LC7/MglB family)